MKKVLIDLNIILDMLNKRKDHEAALAVYDVCVKKKIKGYVCSHEVTTLAYFMSKEKVSKKKRNKIIKSLLENLNVLPADESTLKSALDSEILDYEDAVIDELALRAKIDFIVTRDLQDFRKSKNVVYNAREALECIEASKKSSA